MPLRGEGVAGFRDSFRNERGDSTSAHESLREQLFDRLRAKIHQREGAAGGAGEGDARGEEDEEVFHDSAGAKGGRWEFTL